MSAIVYYTPHLLRAYGRLCANTEIQNFCELFKIVSPNAAVIDRTAVGGLNPPLPTATLNPLPAPDDHGLDFEDLCLQRAADLVAQNRPIYLMYSGGIDSTCILVALHQILKQFQRWDQLTICTTQDSIAENPDAWKDWILPHYQLMSTRSMLASVDLRCNRYVQGENADQLFGSDLIFEYPDLVETPFNEDQLMTWIKRHNVSAAGTAYLHPRFLQLAHACPLPILLFRDFLWWLNITCKWQAVSLRTLVMSNALALGQTVTTEQATYFEPFFNTVPFQQLSMSGRLRRWGGTNQSSTSSYTYKQEARDFILKHSGWDTYCQQKVKVGSLYNVTRLRFIHAPSTLISLEPTGLQAVSSFNRFSA